MNLSWSPRYEESKYDKPEEELAESHNLIYYGFEWGVPTIEDLYGAVMLIDRNLDEGTVLIHCEKGQDRTGCLVAAWKKAHGFSQECDWERHGAPGSKCREVIKNF